MRNRFTNTVYLPNKKIKNKDTYYIFENMSRIYIAHFENKMLHTVTKGDVLEFWQARAEGKTNRGGLRSLASLNRELNCLGGLFKVAVDRGYIKTNPCDGIKRYKLDNAGAIVLEEDEEAKLLGALTGTKALNDVAFDLLKDLRAKCDGKGRVFSERGLTRENVGHQIANICDAIGLPHITMHVMRHYVSCRTISRKTVFTPNHRTFLATNAK